MNERKPPETSEVATSLSTEEAAAYLGVTSQTIRSWIAEGALPAKRVGLRGVFRVKREDLDGMVKAA